MTRDRCGDGQVHRSGARATDRAARSEAVGEHCGPKLGRSPWDKGGVRAASGRGGWCVRRVVSPARRGHRGQNVWRMTSRGMPDATAFVVPMTSKPAASNIAFGLATAAESSRRAGVSGCVSQRVVVPTVPAPPVVVPRPSQEHQKLCPDPPVTCRRAHAESWKEALTCANVARRKSSRPGLASHLAVAHDCTTSSGYTVVVRPHVVHMEATFCTSC